MVAKQAHRHDSPNSAFQGAHSDRSWIEVFHSRPSWKLCQISYSKDGGPWVPFGKFQVRLIVQAAYRYMRCLCFRVFRTKAKRIEFRLANEGTTVIDSNMGRKYVIEGPGRYVVESGTGCRRVSDAQVADCLRAIRPSDKYVELTFESDPLWRKCYVTYAVEGDPDQTWRKMPMEARYEQPGTWFQRIEARKGINCAFSDGAGAWDSNNSLNYQIRLPGKYLAGKGCLAYCGPSDLDLHLG